MGFNRFNVVFLSLKWTKEVFKMLQAKSIVPINITFYNKQNDEYIHVFLSENLFIFKCGFCFKMCCVFR